MTVEARKRLYAEALVVGYAMSRLDRAYLAATHSSSWRVAFTKAGSSLGVRPASLKNLRDEFDPFHDNPRRGWHKRPLRPTREQVITELCDVSDEALMELVIRVLDRDEDATGPAIDALVQPVKIVGNVAERLLTGRRAEEWFLGNCDSIVGISRARILDLRNAATGYDFGVEGAPARAIEVKGLKAKTGEVLFTDREWTEARRRAENYCLVVVGNLTARPMFRLWYDPVIHLAARCRYQKSVAAVWRSTVSVLR